MAPSTWNDFSTSSRAPIPCREAEQPISAPTMTRMAAAVAYDDVKTKMKRRRINTSALHREVGLLERALATFTADSELRLSHVKHMTSYDAERRGGAAGRREDRKPRRQQRGGQRMQRRKRREVAFIESGVEDVKPTHPNPELHPTATLNEHDTRRQVVAVGRRGNKCGRWRKRWSGPRASARQGHRKIAKRERQAQRRGMLQLEG